MSEVRVNSAQAWWLAVRPKTLSGAAVPVVLGVAAAAAEGFGVLWLPAVLCLAFALLMQVDANLVNDYLDWADGVDTAERLGPERAMARGWVSERAMRWAIGGVTAAACAVGLPLTVWGGWWMVAVGAACVLFCFLYTTVCSRRALGDVLVLVFFGLVPVGAVFYIQTGGLTREVVALAAACGLATDAMLVVNNYRDMETDRRVGKRTLATLLGARATRVFLLLTGLAAVALTVPMLGGRWWWMAPYAAFHLWNVRRVYRIGSGRALNGVLATVALSIVVFGLNVTLAILI